MAVNFSGYFPEDTHTNSGACVSQDSFAALHRTQKIVISGHMSFDLGLFFLENDCFGLENSIYIYLRK